jgi:hypothetical protein
MITQVIYYKQSDMIHYKICSKDGILQGTYGRGEHDLHLYLTEQVMGINYAQLDKKTTLTSFQSHEQYLTLGGQKLSVPSKLQQGKVLQR